MYHLKSTVNIRHTMCGVHKYDQRDVSIELKHASQRLERVAEAYNTGLVQSNHYMRGNTCILLSWSIVQYCQSTER